MPRLYTPASDLLRNNTGPIPPQDFILSNVELLTQGHPARREVNFGRTGVHAERSESHDPFSSSRCCCTFDGLGGFGPAGSRSGPWPGHGDALWAEEGGKPRRKVHYHQTRGPGGFDHGGSARRAPGLALAGRWSCSRRRLPLVAGMPKRARRRPGDGQDGPAVVCAYHATCRWKATARCPGQDGESGDQLIGVPASAAEELRKLLKHRPYITGRCSSKSGGSSWMV